MGVEEMMGVSVGAAMMVGLGVLEISEVSVETTLMTGLEGLGISEVSVGTALITGLSTSGASLAIGRSMPELETLIGLSMPTLAEGLVDSMGSDGSSGVVSGLWTPIGFSGNRKVPLFGCGVRLRESQIIL